MPLRVHLLDGAGDDFTQEPLPSNRRHAPSPHATFIASTLEAAPSADSTLVDGVCKSIPLPPGALELSHSRVVDSMGRCSTRALLAALERARAERAHMVLMPIGGPNYADVLLTAKIRELAGAGVTVVAGAGNGGPAWGTVLNPADDGLVVAVGGHTANGTLAAWSARGVANWEGPLGAPRAAVDILALGEYHGRAVDGGCRREWGTSVASPLVVAALARALARVADPLRRKAILNPAALKQLVHAAGAPLPNLSIFEQGMGRFDDARLEVAVADFAPRATAFPPELDLAGSGVSDESRGALWPLDAPLYARGQPRAVNVTIYNSRATLSRIARPPEWEPALDTGGWALSLAFSHAERVDQHCGYVGIAVSVRPEAAAYTGEARGHVVLWLQDEGPGADAMAHSVRIALRAHIMTTPPRERRLLLDTHHSTSYPQGFFPNDDLARLDREVMDWPADGPLAGHLELHRALFAAGYFVEQLTVPFHASGLDPANYGALLLLDPEEPIDSASAANLRAAVERSGLGLVVAADWWSSEQMRALDHADAAVDGAPIRICGSAGAHVPSLNRLLAPWGVRFGEGVWSGAYATGSTAPMIDHASGSAIVSFPRGGLLLRALVHRVRPTARGGEAARRGEPQHVGVLGVARVGAAGGWLAALADSSCTDDSSRRNCRHLLIDLVGHMLGQRLQRAAPLVAPEGHERLVRLVEPESSGATMGSLTNAQAAAFAADSRLLNPTKATVVPPWRGEVVSASVAGEPLVPSIAVCLGLCALCLLACTRAQRRRSILRKPKDC